MRKRLALTAVLAVLASAAQAQASVPSSGPPVGHVFVVFLENENADVTFGPGSPAPYLSQTLPSQGAFIPEYYGVTHLSLGNYTGFVSGQGSNPQIQADCQIFSEFVGGLIGPDGQALGDGCVFPPAREDDRRPAQRAWAEVDGLHGGHGERPNSRERALRTPGPEHG